MIWMKDPKFDIEFPKRDLLGWESEIIAYFGAETQDSAHWVIEWRILCVIYEIIVAGAALTFHTYISGIISVFVIGYIWHELVQYEANRIETIRKYLCEYLSKPRSDTEQKNRGWA